MKNLSDLEYKELMRLAMCNQGESQAILERRLYMIQLILAGEMWQVITDEYGDPYQLKP